VMKPVFESRMSPFGNPAAENVMGRIPVAAMVYKNGEPGRTPKTFAPLIRGFSDTDGVRINDCKESTEWAD